MEGLNGKDWREWVTGASWEGLPPQQWLEGTEERIESDEEMEVMERVATIFDASA